MLLTEHNGFRCREEHSSRSSQLKTLLVKSPMLPTGTHRALKPPPPLLPDFELTSTKVEEGQV